MGIPTLEAVHTWDAAIALNDRSDLDPVTRRYRYWCDKIDLRGMPEAQLPSDQILGGFGAIPRPGARAGKPAVYEGRIEALSAADLRDATDLLEAAFLAVHEEGRMDIGTLLPPGDEFVIDADGDPYLVPEGATSPAGGTVVVAVFDAGGDPAVDTPPLAAAPAEGLIDIDGDPTMVDRASSAPTWFFRGRGTVNVLDAPADTLNAIPTPYQSTFVIALSLSDPRIYSAAGTVVQFSLGAGPAVEGSVENLGLVSSPFVATLYGPWSQPIIEDLTRGVSIRLDLAIAAGEVVVIDFGQGSVVRGADEDVGSTVVWPGSDWWDNRYRDLAAGVTALRFSCLSSAAPARAELTFYPARA